MTLQPVVRTLDHSAIGEAVDVLVEAFTADPGLQWALAGNDAALRLWMEAGAELMRHSIQEPLAAVDPSGRVLGVALLMSPDEKLRLFHALRWVLRVTRRISPRVAARSQRLALQGERWHPGEPFHHLVQLGVRNDARQLGIGSTLIDAAKARVHAHPSSLGIWLETECFRRISWYERRGFVVLGYNRLGSNLSSTGMAWYRPSEEIL